MIIQQLWRAGKSWSCIRNFYKVLENRPKHNWKFSDGVGVLRGYHASRESDNTAVLSAKEVDRVLRANEYSFRFPKEGPVKSYDTNQLASNNPMEDSRSEASCLLTTGVLFGVFDGHGGGACAQVVAKRLYQYIASCLLPPDHLKRYLAYLKTGRHLDLVKRYNDKGQFVEDIRDIHTKSFYDFVHDLTKVGYSNGFEMHKALEVAFTRLDNDLSKEALPDRESGSVNMKTLSVATSGAVSCVAHVDGPHLHIAHIGDCNAVLGVLGDNDSWTSNKLTIEHNAQNRAEVNRIIKEHPYGERSTIIKMERLLGRLAPLRAFGDYEFKWSRKTLEDLAVKHYFKLSLLPNYHTPPYLTAKPEVIYHRLTHRDKFLVIASDGLWEIVSPQAVVQLVGDHMGGKVTLSPLKFVVGNMPSSEINKMLMRRGGCPSRDRNAATYLIRSVLGGGDHRRLSRVLTMRDSREHRDDITITVVYFDSEYMRHCSE